MRFLLFFNICFSRFAVINYGTGDSVLLTLYAELLLESELLMFGNYCWLIWSLHSSTAPFPHDFHSAWWWWDPLHYWFWAPPAFHHVQTPCVPHCVALWLVISWSSDSWWSWFLIGYDLLVLLSFPCAFIKFLFSHCLCSWFWLTCDKTGVQTTLHTQKQSTGSSPTGYLSCSRFRPSGEFLKISNTIARLAGLKQIIMIN